jgi:8-oxo-dGTP pyrophosphatase MutT (NUDIX family)
MPITVRKALAYITHRDRLLVFSHPHHPEAGIQVPAGTMKDGEHPAAAVMREAFEETGLVDLTLAGFLGEERRDMSDFGLDQIHHRHYFHLRCESDPPETWRHFETDPSDGSATPIEFELFWVPLPDGVPALIADQGRMLPQLLRHLAITA